MSAVIGGLGGSIVHAEDGAAGGRFRTSYGSFVPGGAPELATQTRFVASQPSPTAQPSAAPPAPIGAARVVRVILPSPYMNDR